MNLEITQVSNPTTDSVSLHFKKPSDLDYKAGQYGRFKFLINNEKLSRTYSFHTSPATDPDLGITVKRVEGGLVSNQLIDHQIREVEFDGVNGTFFVQGSPEIARHLIMVAAGSGITPIMSMIKTILYVEPDSSISLIYSNRTFDRIIFRDELLKLGQQFQRRLKVFHVLTNDIQVPADFAVFHNERLSKLVMKKLIKGILADMNCFIEFYLSGPYEFMRLAEDAIKSIRTGKTKIYKEHFYTPSDHEHDFDVSKFSEQEVVIQLKNEARLLMVGPGKSILEASLANGISLAHSCKDGQCGVCRANVMSGEVQMRKNHVLSPDELSSGQILLCQGFPATENVVVRPLA